MATVIVFIWAPLLALALLVLFSYQEAWKHRSDGNRGLLPLHVAVVAFSYLILATLGAAEVVFDDTPIWKTAAITLALVLGLVAMIIVLRYEQKSGGPTINE
jgi:hypothetical protein